MAICLVDGVDNKHEGLKGRVMGFGGGGNCVADMMSALYKR